jgi:hypothetical protein
MAKHDGQQIQQAINIRQSLKAQARYAGGRGEEVHITTELFENGLRALAALESVGRTLESLDAEVRDLKGQVKGYKDAISSMRLNVHAEQVNVTKVIHVDDEEDYGI